MMQLTQNRVAGSTILALGVLLAVLMAAMLSAAKPVHAATTFTVNSTGDKGDQTPADGKCFTGDVLVVQGDECTLRAAIEVANETPGADTINFDIPGTAANTVTPASRLPAITSPVTIDGYSQPGAKPNTKAAGNNAVLKIELSGASVPTRHGLEIDAANSTVKGLVINRWAVGVYILSGATGNKVEGNYVGTDASGTQDLGNSGTGVAISYAPANTIGGEKAATRNVISGNDEYGVFIGGDAATGNQVTGNYVGTDKNGIADLGNGDSGVVIYGAPNNAIGGTTAAMRNVISGNDEYGVFIEGANATGNQVTGNYLGTDASGTKDLGDDAYGVRILDAPNNTIGGTTAGARNVISANGIDGVIIEGYGSGNSATGNNVMGNYVGTDASGTKDLGNSLYGVRILDAPNNTIGGATAAERNIISGNDFHGVAIYNTGIMGNKAIDNKVEGNYVGTDASGTKDLGNSGTGVEIAAPANTVGGTQAGARNIISANTGDGVHILGDSATGNRVLSNSIFSNGGLGIDLGGDGPTANDPGDADTGANDLQNKPAITSAKTSASSTTVQGKLNSTPNKTFTVQFFSNPSGADEGKKFMGQKNVTTGADGKASFTFSTEEKVGAGRSVTATATDSGGNTSEFSAPKTVVAQ